MGILLDFVLVQCLIMCVVNCFGFVGKVGLENFGEVIFFLGV